MPKKISEQCTIRTCTPKCSQGLRLDLKIFPLDKGNIKKEAKIPPETGIVPLREVNQIFQNEDFKIPNGLKMSRALIMH